MCTIYSVVLINARMFINFRKLCLNINNLSPNAWQRSLLCQLRVRLPLGKVPPLCVLSTCFSTMLFSCLRCLDDIYQWPLNSDFPLGYFWSLPSKSHHGVSWHSTTLPPWLRSVGTASACCPCRGHGAVSSGWRTTISWGWQVTGEFASTRAETPGHTQFRMLPCTGQPCW